MQSGELLNTNKEEYALERSQNEETVSFMVRYSDDYEGKAVTDTVWDRFQAHFVENIRKGVIWNIEIPAESPEERMKIATEILQTYLLYNPYSQECLLVT